MRRYLFPIRIIVMFDVCERALKYASSSDWAEARLEHKTSSTSALKNGIPETQGFEKSLGIAVRLLLNGSLGVSFTNDFSDESLKRTINAALKMAKSASRLNRKPVVFSEERTEEDDYSVPQKTKLEDVSPEEKMKRLIELDKVVKATKLPIPFRYMALSDWTTEKFYLNTEGTRIRSLIPSFNFYYLLTAKVGNETAQRSNQVGGTGGWEIFNRSKPEEKLLEESRSLVKSIGAPKFKEDVVDIVISPEITGIASHESVGHPYEADRILGREAAQAGESFLDADSRGMKIGSSLVTVVDDPTLKGSFGFYKYDDEGVLARRRFLMKNGIVNEFLHNRSTASYFGLKSNGAARAGLWDREPIVRMANTFVQEGDHTLEELLEGVKKGVYIKSYMEWNIDDKRWNQRYVGLEAWKVVNGNLVSLVKRPVLELTTAAFWSAVDAVGKDTGFFPGSCGKNDPMDPTPVWFGGPSMRLRKIRLG